MKPAHTQAHREGTVWLGLCVTEMSKERAGEAGDAGEAEDAGEV